MNSAAYINSPHKVYLAKSCGTISEVKTKMHTVDINFLFPSSRSHLLFTLKVEGHDIVSRATTNGRLTLVDLAGSERISRSESTGIRLVEAAAINKSLSALGQVGVASQVTYYPQW